jgi:hypothetical protein
MTELLKMDDTSFRELVDAEVRGRASPELTASLRSPEIAERWYQQLLVMKKSVESTLAAKTAEDKEQRLVLLDAADSVSDPDQAADLRRRANQSRAQYLKWRAGALRFRAGVEERLAEAAWRRRLAGSVNPAALLEERNQLLGRLGMLTEAIQAHRDSMADVASEDIDDADRELWEVLTSYASSVR